MCSIDPQTTSLMVPIAQASLIAAPYFLRDRIIRVVRKASGRDTGAGAEPNEDHAFDEQAAAAPPGPAGQSPDAEERAV